MMIFLQWLIPPPTDEPQQEHHSLSVMRKTTPQAARTVRIPKARNDSVLLGFLCAKTQTKVSPKKQMEEKWQHDKAEWWHWNLWILLSYFFFLGSYFGQCTVWLSGNIKFGNLPLYLVCAIYIPLFVIFVVLLDNFSKSLICLPASGSTYISAQLDPGIKPITSRQPEISSQKLLFPRLYSIGHNLLSDVYSFLFIFGSHAVLISMLNLLIGWFECSMCAACFKSLILQFFLCLTLFHQMEKS